MKPRSPNTVPKSVAERNKIRNRSAPTKPPRKDEPMSFDLRWWLLGY